MAEIPRVPFFEVQFVFLMLGAVLFLISGALVRNVVVTGSRGWLVDEVLESGISLLVALGVLALLVVYPILRRRDQLTWWPYLLFVSSALWVSGQMLFWGWWYGDLPGIAPLGASP